MTEKRYESQARRRLRKGANDKDNKSKALSG